MFDISEKIAIVTGASQGIGRTIAKILSKSGAHVICIARTENKIIDLVEEIRKDNGLADYISCDVSDSDAFSNSVNTVIKDHGKIDILINNAGITRDALLMRMTEDQWEEVINTNLKGAFYGMKSVIRSMMKNKFGRIINISSVAGLMGNSGQVNYSSSKSAMVGFSRSLAKELGSRNITSNVVAPGFIETDMTTFLNNDEKVEVSKNIPMKRFGTVEDVAKCIVFLASDEANYITGQTISVDGGLFMY